MFFFSDLKTFYGISQEKWLSVKLMREQGQILQISKKWPKWLLRALGSKIGQTAAEKPTISMAKHAKYVKKAKKNR